jgi:hypothetical protein
MLSVKWDQHGLDDELDDMVSALEDAVRPAAQAGAQVYYEDVLSRVPVSAAPRVYKGKTYQPGTLKKSIYQAFSADNSGKGYAEYHVSWNAKKAPHGHNIENGHWLKQWGKNKIDPPVWVPARSFIRATYEAASGRAVEATWQELLNQVRGVIK